MARPETRYTKVGEVNIAYQVIGDGPTDLLMFLNLGNSCEVMWDVPICADFLARLASFTRLILFDRRGIGVSDAVPQNAIPTWEDLSEDAGAVLDAVQSKQAAILAANECGPMALLFAAMHPERVSALALFCTYARFLVAEDFDIGAPSEIVGSNVEMSRTLWGTADLIRLIVPGLADDNELIEKYASMFRVSATPRAAAVQFDYLFRHVDARQALPLIKVPTVVLHPLDASFISLDHARYLAEHIEGARLVEVPGTDLALVAEGADQCVEEIAQLLTGERAPDVERVLATLLFTDIAESTAKAASLGDHRWRSLLDSHDRAIREQLRRFRGREVNTTGDGFVASFDGPAKAIRCAVAIAEVTRPLGIEIRAGLHTGECEVRGDDLAGLAVHIAARVGALASPGEVLTSGTVKDLVVGSGIEFEERGEHALKGVPGTWKLFAVRG